MKTRRRRSRLACHDRQRRRRRAMSERPCSRANSVFFEPKSFAAQEQPNRIVRDFDPAHSQFVLQGVECQMWRLAEPLHDERSMRIKHSLAVSAHLAGRDRAGGAVTLRPLHNRRNLNAKPHSSRPAALALRNCRNHPPTQIVGKGFHHQMLASLPNDASGKRVDRFRRQDYELPDRRIRYLRFASWPCVHRSRVVSFKGMDRQSRSSGSHVCARRHGLCDQTKACDENDRTRDSRVCTIQVGCCRYGLRCRRYRTATTPCRQRLCLGSSAHVFNSWGKRRSVSAPPRKSPQRDVHPMETPVSRGRNQRTEAARLVLSRACRSRCRAV